MRIANERIALECRDDGGGVVLEDRRRGQRWRLDEDSLVAGPAAGDTPDPATARAVPAGAVGDGDTLTLELRAGAVGARLVFALRANHVEVRCAPAPGLGLVSLPGSFCAEDGSAQLLLPIMQGMLWDGRGDAFDLVKPESSHTGFTMAFTGWLGGRGGLLMALDTRDDARWWLGKSAAGRCWSASLQIDELGALGYERVARLYPTDASIVAVARRYRAHVQAAGRFRGWDQKLAERPALERLFGSLMCFVGYCASDVDYAAECRRLRDYGFDRALVYPVRFNAFDDDVRMGGAPAIDLDREQVAAIRALGYDVAPWSWLNEALDDGSPARRVLYRCSPDGTPQAAWKIDDQQWYRVCAGHLAGHQARALAADGRVADLTWDHFDVLACVPPMPCHARDHASHPGEPQTRRGDREQVRRLFAEVRRHGRAVSSEGFNDAYSADYDLGSVKALPRYGARPFWPVPLTGLVYHDSLIHSWWEVHNYNGHHFDGGDIDGGLFEYGGGRTRRMAALDALSGCPPDVFPFGAQYGWTGRERETFLYQVRFDDDAVQTALRSALPVARLHRHTGPQDLVDFEILADDGCVQATTFADGTRVVASFADRPRDVDAAGGTMVAESWRVVDGPCAGMGSP